MSKTKAAGLKIQTFIILQQLAGSLKMQALKAGSYAPPYSSSAYDTRDKCQCPVLRYLILVRRIDALEDAMSVLQNHNHVPKGASDVE